MPDDYFNWRALAEAAWDAHRDALRSPDARTKLPDFHTLPESVQKAWEAAAQAAVDIYVRAVLA